MPKRPAASLIVSLIASLSLACDRVGAPTEPELLGARATMAIVTSASADLIVDDDRAQCPQANFATIQEAINAATSGQVIFVCAGVYPETAEGKLTVNKTLTLAGVQNGVDARSRSGPESIIADAQGTSVSASNVVIDGFTVRNTTTAVETPFGIWLNPGINGTQVLNNIIEDNTIGLGLANAGATQAVIRNNWFRNNNAPGHFASGSGIYTDEVVGGQTTRNVLIEGNRFTGHGAGAAILTFNTAFSNGGVFGLDIRSNTFSQNGRAFLLFNTHSSTFDGNTISGATQVENADFRILDNNTNLTFTRNNLSDGVAHAMSVRMDFGLPSSNIVFNQNNIERYGLTGLTIEPGAHVGTVNAECNWWNSSTGPTASGNPGGTGEEVVGDADYNPWLVARAPGGACTGGAPPPPNQPPVASFTHSCSGLTCSFMSTSSDPDGSVASYSWTFGDGTPAVTTQNPSHTYAAPGTYTVALTVTDNQGATNSTSQSVTVARANQPPVASFTHSCSGLTCSFTSTSGDPDGSIASYSWNFGDGTPPVTTQNPSHTYAAGGTYTVTLTVTDNQGATNSTSQSVTVTRPNQPPVASFTQSCSGLTCSFTSTSGDPDGSIASYRWTFGDGTPPVTTQNPSHTYAAGGTYTVTLTVTDNQGATNSTSKSVTVTPPNSPPVVNAGPDETAITGLLYQFTGSFSDANNNGPWLVTIEWGDGQTTTFTCTNPGTITANHTYITLLPRNFTIRVTVRDAAGATGSDTKVLRVLLL